MANLYYRFTVGWHLPVAVLKHGSQTHSVFLFWQYSICLIAALDLKRMVFTNCSMSSFCASGVQMSSYWQSWALTLVYQHSPYFFKYVLMYVLCWPQFGFSSVGAN